MNYLAGVLALVVTLLGFGLMAEKAAHASTREKAQARMAFLHEQAQQAEAAQRQTEKELSDAAIQNATRVDRLIAQNRNRSVRSAGDADRLRSQAAEFASSNGEGCPTPTAAADIEAGPSAAMVLADLLGRADARANDLAHAADEARTRGLACEADYDRAQQVRSEPLP